MSLGRGGGDYDAGFPNKVGMNIPTPPQHVHSAARLSDPISLPGVTTMDGFNQAGLNAFAAFNAFAAQSLAVSYSSCCYISSRDTAYRSIFFFLYVFRARLSFCCSQLEMMATHAAPPRVCSREMSNIVRLARVKITRVVHLSAFRFVSALTFPRVCRRRVPTAPPWRRQRQHPVDTSLPITPCLELGRNMFTNIIIIRIVHLGSTRLAHLPPP